MHVLAAAASGDGIWNGLAPNWGPFGQLGTVGKTIIDVILAGVLLFFVARFLLGVSRLRVAKSVSDPVGYDSGRGEALSSLAGVAIALSVSTIFTMVSGLAF